MPTEISKKKKIAVIVTAFFGLVAVIILCTLFTGHGSVSDLLGLIPEDYSFACGGAKANSVYSSFTQSPAFKLLDRDARAQILKLKTNFRFLRGGVCICVLSKGWSFHADLGFKSIMAAKFLEASCRSGTLQNYRIKAITYDENKIFYELTSQQGQQYMLHINGSHLIITGTRETMLDLVSVASGHKRNLLSQQGFSYEHFLKLTNSKPIFILISRQIAPDTSSGRIKFGSRFGTFDPKDLRADCFINSEGKDAYRYANTFIENYSVKKLVSKTEEENGISKLTFSSLPLLSMGAQFSGSKSSFLSSLFDFSIYFTDKNNTLHGSNSLVRLKKHEFKGKQPVQISIESSIIKALLAAGESFISLPISITRLIQLLNRVDDLILFIDNTEANDTLNIGLKLNYRRGE